MKKPFLRIMGSVLLLSFLSLGSFSCMGRFGLTKKVYNFNDTITSNKYINNIIFWIIGGALCGISLVIDLIILNTIEFWTGSNPVAMNDTDKEIKVVQNEFGKFEITATKNRLEVVRLDSKIQEKRVLVYQPRNNSWYLESDGIFQKVAELNSDTGNYNFFTPEGEKLELNI